MLHLFPADAPLDLDRLRHGAEFVTTYRYRQPRFGVEMFHHGLVGPMASRRRPAGREFQQTIDEIAPGSREEALALRIGGAADEPDAGSVRHLALLDFEQLWYLPDRSRRRKRWDYAHAFSDSGMPRSPAWAEGADHPRRAAMADDLKLLVSPGVQMVDEAMVEQLDATMSRTAGISLLTCRTALMDRTGQFFEGPLGQPILRSDRRHIEAYDGLPEGAFAQVETGRSEI